MNSKMIKKTISVCSALICAMSSSGISVGALGFEDDTWGTKYYYDDDSYIKSDLVEINGNKYLFNDIGYIVKGIYFYNNDDKFGYPRMHYFDEETGAMLYGMQQVFARQYYFDRETGFAVFDDFVKVGDNYYYYFNYDGICIKQLTEDEYLGYKYRSLRGWQTEEDGKHYYSKKCGYELKGFNKIGDSYYYFNKDGVRVSYVTIKLHYRYAIFDYNGKLVNALTATEYNDLKNGYFKTYKKHKGSYNFAKWYIRYYLNGNIIEE